MRLYTHPPLIVGRDRSTGTETSEMCCSGFLFNTTLQVINRKRLFDLQFGSERKSVDTAVLRPCMEDAVTKIAA
jgi:hypothetical protein